MDNPCIFTRSLYVLFFSFTFCIIIRKWKYIIPLFISNMANLLMSGGSKQIELIHFEYTEWFNAKWKLLSTISFIFKCSIFVLMEFTWLPIKISHVPAIGSTGQLFSILHPTTTLFWYWIGLNTNGTQAEAIKGVDRILLENKRFPLLQYPLQ